MYLNTYLPWEIGVFVEGTGSSVFKICSPKYHKFIKNDNSICAMKHMNQNELIHIYIYEMKNIHIYDMIYICVK